MANVTIAGPGGTVAAKIVMDSATNAQLAQNLLASTNADLASGAITPFTVRSTSGGVSAIVPAGQQVLFVPAAATVVVPAVSPQSVVLDFSGQSDVIVGGASANQLVETGQGGVTYTTNIGSGTIIAGGGNNIITTTTVAGGDHLILTGNGNDKILALTGDNTIGAGGGNNTITAGTGNNLVDVTGADTVYAGSGAATVDVTSGTAVVYGSSGQLSLLNAGGAATVFAGTDGAATVGGTAGSTTLFGAASGDTLVAAGGSGTNNLLIGGAGSQTLVGGGTGRDTLTGGSGADIFRFVDGQAGGAVVVSDFTVGTDTISLSGYGTNPSIVTGLLNAATHPGGTSTQIVLGDNTTITLTGVTNLTSNSFKLS